MSESQFDAFVAGAGIWGCTVARRLAEQGKRVLVLEKRPVVGGNVRCEIDPSTGIEVHTYGSHIFHTKIPSVWSFVNRFVSFNGYQHKVLAWYKGRAYYLPLGLPLINKFFGVELKPGEVGAFLDGTFTPPGADHLSPGADRRQAIFDAFFRGYTSKQWGKAPEEIDPSIIKRVPVRSNYDINYFNDYWQGIPMEGYNALFERMLDHPGITVRTNASLKLEEGAFVIADGSGRDGMRIPCADGSVRVYYSGPIDALFGYKYGSLPWRTLRFECEVLDEIDHQGTSVVNYTEAEVPYTRVHEFKHYHPEPVGPLSQAENLKSLKRTIVMREYSATWQPGDEPYYPVNNPESEALLKRYQEEAKACPNLVVGGRLGAYRYFDMDKSIEAALELPLTQT